MLWTLGLCSPTIVDHRGQGSVNNWVYKAVHMYSPDHIGVAGWQLHGKLMLAWRTGLIEMGKQPLHKCTWLWKETENPVMDGQTDTTYCTHHQAFDVSFSNIFTILNSNEEISLQDWLCLVRGMNPWWGTSFSNISYIKCESQSCFHRMLVRHGSIHAFPSTHGNRMVPQLEAILCQLCKYCL